MTTATAGFSVVLAVVVCGLIAAILHELTHYSVARLAGREAWIDWRELNERHVIPPGGPDLRDLAVGVSPFILGGIIGVGWLAAQLPISLPAVIAWGVYTLNGIPNDFRV